FDHSNMLGPASNELGTLQSFRCVRFGITCDQDVDSIGDKTNCHPDDTSPFMTRVDALADFLATQKPDPQRVMFGAIVGTTNPVKVQQTTINGQNDIAIAHSCTYRPANSAVDVGADPAVRFGAFASRFAG